MPCFAPGPAWHRYWEVLAAAGAPLNEPDPTVSEADALLDAYERFLLTERGLVASTTSAYVLRARRFLDWHGHGADLRAVDTAVVTSAVLGEADRVSAGSAQFFVVALRSFLRYCHLEWCDRHRPVRGVVAGDRTAPLDPAPRHQRCPGTVVVEGLRSPHNGWAP